MSCAVPCLPSQDWRIARSLSVTNAREHAHIQIAKEADEIEHAPDAERHELALIYQSKGLHADEARRVAAQMMRDKDKALDTLTCSMAAVLRSRHSGKSSSGWSLQGLRSVSAGCWISPCHRLRSFQSDVRLC
jgi:VIT1/CCC1 family predicted Fe2+/Mn2+ transporter